METKILEVRDSATFFLALCVDMNPTQIGGDGAYLSINDQIEIHNYQRWALRTYGYPCDWKPNILMTHLRAKGEAHNDPYAWKNNGRTMAEAHKYIIANWGTLAEGDVVDVEFILGETKFPKPSQRATRESEAPF